MDHALAVSLRCEFIEPLDGSQVLGKARRPELRVGLAEVIAFESCRRAHLAAEQPTAERAIAEDSDAVAMAIGKDLRLDAALEYVIRRLQTVERRYLPETLHLLYREVADADRADPAKIIETAQRLGRPLDGDQRIGPVHLVEINIVGAQARQRIPDFPEDALVACVAEHLAIAPFKADLGGDLHLGAQPALGEGLADDLLRLTEAVDGGSIDDVDALFDGRPNGGDRLSFVAAAPHPAPHGPGPEGDSRHIERSVGDHCCFHGFLHATRIATVAVCLLNIWSPPRPALCQSC